MNALKVLCMEDVNLEPSHPNCLKEKTFMAIAVWVCLVSLIYCYWLFTCLHIFLASQAWTLAIILPMLIGHRIPEDDLHWDCFILMLQIVQLSTAKVVSPSSTTYLASLIDQHHQTFKQCYPGIKISPKMHYMVHFSQQIMRLDNSVCVM